MATPVPPGPATVTVTTTATPTPADWHLAHQQAQQRITRLQQQRAEEASSRPRLSSVLDSARPSFRVGQLDTELLDEELLELLKNQLWGGLKYFRPSFKESYEPEFLLLLRAALFKLTIWDNNATYGAALQNLRYCDARTGGLADRPPTGVQKGLYGLVTVGGRYVFSRLNLFLLARSNPEDSTPATTKLSNLLDSLSTVHSTLTLLSFTAFLVTGSYRTLLDRILRMRLISPNRVVSREVSFEYLNRQLVWHAFTEFLLFILPLVRVGRWRRWWARILRKVRGDRGEGDSGELGFLPERSCAVCYKELDASADGGLGVAGKATDVVNPYETVECSHIYCYVCIAGKIELEEGEGWTCLRCGGNVKRCRPWRGGLKGLTAVGDWGEEVVERRKVGFDDEDESAVVSDLEDEDTDGEATERGDEDSADSEQTEKAHRHRRRRRGRGRGSDWSEESMEGSSVFDESCYQTAEGEDSE